MKRYDTSALQIERKEELEELRPLNLLPEEETELAPFAEWETSPSRCPPDSPYIVRGFARHSGYLSGLPNDQRWKFKSIAKEINNSLSGAQGATPVTQVLIAGHADPDPARERREPGFLQFISEQRALTAYSHLWCTTPESFGTTLSWFVVGRGARALAVPNPRSESERKCNRRVEITLFRSAQLLPRLDGNERVQAGTDQTAFRDYYYTALQGTSGQFDRPAVAEKKAREIAEKVPAFLERRKRIRDLYGINCRIKLQTASGGYRDAYDDPTDFLKYFADALQGTASKFSDPDVAINKAAEIAEITTFGLLQASKKFLWKYASLPQPMAPDCEAGVRVPGGRVNHVVCTPHGHIIDKTTRMVIARDPEEYRKRFPK